MENKHTTGHLLAVLTILIWGTTFISTKILLNDFTPVEILFFRFILGFVALMIVYPHRLKVVNKKHELLFAAAGLCGVTLYYLLENIALTYTMASNVGVLCISTIFYYDCCLFVFERRTVAAQFFLRICRCHGRYLSN